MTRGNNRKNYQIISKLDGAITVGANLPAKNLKAGWTKFLHCFQTFIEPANIIWFDQFLCAGTFANFVKVKTFCWHRLTATSLIALFKLISNKIKFGQISTTPSCNRSEIRRENSNTTKNWNTILNEILTFFGILLKRHRDRSKATEFGFDFFDSIVADFKSLPPFIESLFLRNLFSLENKFGGQCY